MAWQGRWFTLAALVAVAPGCGERHASTDFTIVRRFPHDVSAYTQGLLYLDGQLYESTGLWGQSTVRRVDLQTGRVEQSRPLPATRFGEGLALLNGKLYQLTWKSGIGYVYDLKTLAPVDSFQYTGEGWGLTTDGTSLIMSDGTPTLRFLDPHTFTVVRSVTVNDHGSPLKEINELEYIHGAIFANIYQSDWIVRIDPATGAVLSWIDLAGILPDKERTATTDVLNGIAYDDATGHLLVTGKLWPQLFEIEVPVPLSDSGAPAAGGNSGR